MTPSDVTLAAHLGDDTHKEGLLLAARQTADCVAGRAPRSELLCRCAPPGLTFTIFRSFCFHTVSSTVSCVPHPFCFPRPRGRREMLAAKFEPS